MINHSPRQRRRKCLSLNQSTNLQLDGDIDGEDAWEVVEIVDERRKKRGKRHYVQYKVVHVEG